MGLYTGFKSECIKRFPKSWNKKIDKNNNTYHIFDGMCIVHGFSFDDTDEILNGFEQLFVYFCNSIDYYTKSDESRIIVLVFDITCEIPSTKIEELERRSNLKETKDIISRGDVKNGLMPEPFDAALENRELRMDICSELTKRLLAHYPRMIFYGCIDNRFMFVNNEYQSPFLEGSAPQLFGEADISIAYVIKTLKSPQCIIYSVDTDLIPIMMTSLDGVDSQVFINLSHYDRKLKKRVNNTIDINSFRQEVFETYNISTDDFVCLCILQGTDFIERIINRGSWSTLFDAIRLYKINNIVCSKERTFDIDTKKIIDILYKTSPKTICASGTKKRQKIEISDVFIDRGTINRLCWQLMYWKFSIHVGYETIKNKIPLGWDMERESIVSKKYIDSIHYSSSEVVHVDVL